MALTMYRRWDMLSPNPLPLTDKINAARNSLKHLLAVYGVVRSSSSGGGGGGSSSDSSSSRDSSSSISARRARRLPAWQVERYSSRLRPPPTPRFSPVPTPSSHSSPWPNPRARARAQTRCPPPSWVVTTKPSSTSPQLARTGWHRGEILPTSRRSTPPKSPTPAARTRVLVGRTFGTGTRRRRRGLACCSCSRLAFRVRGPFRIRVRVSAGWP